MKTIDEYIAYLAFLLLLKYMLIYEKDSIVRTRL